MSREPKEMSWGHEHDWNCVHDHGPVYSVPEPSVAMLLVAGVLVMGLIKLVKRK